MDTSAATSHLARGPVRTGTDGTLRLLLVEDDDGDALLVGEHLRDVGLDAGLVRVRSLDEAARWTEVDCVLLDLGLPDAAGLGALQRMLAAGPAPVVVLTGLTDAGAGLDAVAAGAQDYLVKGDVDGEAIARSVRYAVQRRRLEHADRELYRSRVRAAEANRLEAALLPRPLVADPRIEVRVGYRAGRDGLLGGDFYDVVERADGTILAMVGDVCGHGPDAAALGATLRTAWRTLVLAGTPADQVLELLERVLVAERSRPEVFTTASMLAVHPGRRSADLYLAGHPEPLLVGPPSALLPAHARGRALGVPVPGGWTPAGLDLGEQWRLLMYTDGVVESTVAGSRRRLGAAGLAQVADATLGGPSAGARELHAGEDPVLGGLLARVRRMHGGDLVDDAALVLLGWAA